MSLFLQANLSMLEELGRNFLGVIDNLVGALLLLIIGFIIARLISRLFRKLLRTIGIDRLADRLNEIDLFYKNNIKITYPIGVAFGKFGEDPQMGTLKES